MQEAGLTLLPGVIDVALASPDSSDPLLPAPDPPSSHQEEAWVIGFI